MGGGDSGSPQGGEGLARHLRHGGGRRQGLRRGGPPLPRKPSQAQLPRERQSYPSASTSLHLRHRKPSRSGDHPFAAGAAELLPDDAVSSLLFRHRPSPRLHSVLSATPELRRLLRGTSTTATTTTADGELVRTDVV